MPARLRSALAAAFLLASLAPAAAAEPAAAPITVELNKLDTTGADCRVTMVVVNGTTSKLDSLKLELVVFDGDGIAASHLATEFGPLVAGKTVVKAFPVAGLACEKVGRVLVNGVLACGGPDGDVADCIDRLSVSSRAAATLIK